MEVVLRNWTKMTLMIAIITTNYPILSNSLSPDMTILNTNTEGLTCVEYETINQLKNLEELIMQSRIMSYFPDKNCSNPAHEEDNRS